MAYSQVAATPGSGQLSGGSENVMPAFPQVAAPYSGQDNGITKPKLAEELKDTLKQLDNCNDDYELQQIAGAVDSIMSRSVLCSDVFAEGPQGRSADIARMRAAATKLRKSGNKAEAKRIHEICNLMEKLPKQKNHPKKQRKTLRKILRLAGKNAGVKIGNSGLCGYSLLCNVACLTGAAVVIAGASVVVTLAATGMLDVCDVDVDAGDGQAESGVESGADGVTDLSLHNDFNVIESVQGSIARYNAELTEADNVVSALKDSSEIQSANANISQLRVELTETDEIVTSLKVSIAKLEESLVNGKATLEKAFETFGNEIDELVDSRDEIDVTGLQGDSDQLDNEVDGIIAKLEELNRLKQQLKEAEDKVTSTGGRIATLRDELGEQLEKQQAEEAEEASRRQRVLEEEEEQNSREFDASRFDDPIDAAENDGEIYYINMSSGERWEYPTEAERDAALMDYRFIKSRGNGVGGFSVTGGRLGELTQAELVEEHPHADPLWEDWEKYRV